jgi:hypothetical protein
MTGVPCMLILTLLSRSSSKYFKNSVRTSKRTPNFTITKISWLVLFNEMSDVYSENHTEARNSENCVTDC